VRGAGPMVEIFADRMEITNPGEPLVDTLRFIDCPPKTRNEGVADYCRDDRRRTGQGIQPRDRATVFDVCPVLGVKAIVLVM